MYHLNEVKQTEQRGKYIRLEEDFMFARTSELQRTCSSLSLCNVKCFLLLTEEYEIYMKKQEATFKTEVTAVVQEPRVGDVPPVVVTTMEQMTTTIISGQVGASLGLTGGSLVEALEDVSYQGNFTYL